jgi:hypothetical protein
MNINTTLMPTSSNIHVGRTALEQAQAAFTKLFNPAYDSNGASFRSLMDAYVALTGDSFMHGDFFPERCSAGLRACMDFSSTSFAFGLQNALSMYLSKEYKRFPYHEEILISDRKEAKDFRTVHSVQLGYFDELPSVDPAAADYDSIAPYGDTETQYDIGQKGTVIFVTRKHIQNDSIGLIKAMVSRMARVARKTHAQYVWDFFINNSNCPDGTAWFSLAHQNLGSDALDFTAVVTAISALAGMTEPTPSGTKLGLDLATFNWNLVVPIDLWDTATKLNQARVTDVNNTPNPLHHLFGERNERIITCPFLTDPNDWGLVRDPQDIPIIEMSYLNGQQDPEFIYEEHPTHDEHVFKGDKWGYKVRHEYGGALADWRSAYQAQVA